MDSIEFNKIAGWVLGTALFVFGLNEVAGIVYHADTPEKPGFAIEVAEAATGEAAGEGEKAAEVSVGTLLATANAEKGMSVFKKSCASCHDVTSGGPNRTGPNLWGIVGRNHAAHEGFAYSEPMAAKSSEPWSYEALNEFIKAPQAAVPKTKMAFGGVKKNADRADLLAYLATLSDSPVPFPAP